jgi:hypothetical protein
MEIPMSLRRSLFAGLFAAVAFAMVPGVDGLMSTSALAACDPGDKIDGTTAADAKRRIEAQGYTQVKVIRKGCDSYWHATAVKNGVGGRIVLSPQGQVMPEGE